MPLDAAFKPLQPSFLSWVGGKSKLVDRIVPLIPDHHTYVEVFAGAAWVLFAKPPSKVEVLNDINLDLVTLYRVVQNHLDEFIRYLRWLLVSREEFDRFLKTDAATLTDVQRAVRFYYLVKTGYGSKLKSPTFSIGSMRPSNLNLLRIEEDLSLAHQRLARVYVENRHFSKIITQHDRPETFFYLDPPYYQCEDYYGAGIFSRSDFQTLADQLATIKGRCMVSLNDHPEVRRIFSRFHLKPVSTQYALGTRDRSQKIAELLILNYDPATLTKRRPKRP